MAELILCATTHVCSDADMRRACICTRAWSGEHSGVPHLSKPVISGVVASNKADGSSNILV
jgi:hypothetical protein